MSSYIPGSPVAAIENPGVESQIGCLYCLKEGLQTPAGLYYLWSGTSVCAKHVLALSQPAQPAQEAVAAQ